MIGRSAAAPFRLVLRAVCAKLPPCPIRLRTRCAAFRPGSPAPVGDLRSGSGSPFCGDRDPFEHLRPSCGRCAEERATSLRRFVETNSGVCRHSSLQTACRPRSNIRELRAASQGQGRRRQDVKSARKGASGASAMRFRSPGSPISPDTTVTRANCCRPPMTVPVGALLDSCGHLGSRWETRRVDAVGETLEATVANSRYQFQTGSLSGDAVAASLAISRYLPATIRPRKATRSRSSGRWRGNTRFTFISVGDALTRRRDPRSFRRR